MVSLELHSKTLFLATLMHELTIVGRNSYRVQSEELDKPSQLRKINEVQHRVAACLCQILAGKADEGFQESIASWVLEQQDDELQGLMLYAWNNAKKRVT